MQGLRLILAVVFALAVSACYVAEVPEHGTAHAECAAGVIKIVDAYYGLPGDVNEACAIAAGTCPNPNGALDLVKLACDGKTSCDVVAENSVFGDPCEGTFKSFKMTYNCVCAKKIILKQMPGVGPLYFGLRVIDSTEKIVKVELQGPNMKAMDPTWWMDMPPMAGGYWAVNPPGPLSLPLSIQLTSATGKILVFEEVITEFLAGKEYSDDYMCFELAPPPPPLCHDVGNCLPAITLRQADGVGPHYFGLFVLCATEKIARVRIHDPYMAIPFYWLDLEPMAGGYWAVNVNAPRFLSLPLQVQLITTTGHVLTLNRKIYMFLSQKYVDTDQCFEMNMPV